MSTLNLFDSTDTDSENASKSSGMQSVSSKTVFLGIAGLRYERGFISEDEQGKIVHLVDKNPWLHEFERRVQHYGYKYNYKARRIDESMHLGELPRWLQYLGERLVEVGAFPSKPDQVIVNEYLPGQGITAHIDCEPCFEDTVVSLTTLSGCYMDFTDINSDAKQSVYLEPCSIVVLRDDARYLWKHGIAKRQKDVVNGIARERG